MPQSFTITVEAVNDAPDLTLGADIALGEDPGAQSVAGFALSGPGGGADEAGQIVTLDVQNDNAGLFSVAPSIDAAGTLGFTPAPGASGQATVTVTATDDGGTANGGVDATQRTFVITISETDAPPVAVDDAETTSEDVAVAIDVLDNDTDADGGPKAVVGFSQGVERRGHRDRRRHAHLHAGRGLQRDRQLHLQPDPGRIRGDRHRDDRSGQRRASGGRRSGHRDSGHVAVHRRARQRRDSDGDALTIVGVTDGLYGDVIIQGSEVGYLRDTDGPAVFPGDSFTYTVEDHVRGAVHRHGDDRRGNAAAIGGDGHSAGLLRWGTGRNQGLRHGPGRRGQRSGDRFGRPHRSGVRGRGDRGGRDHRVRIADTDLATQSGWNRGIEIRLFDGADAIASSGNGVLTDPGFDTFDFVPFQVTDSWAKGERDRHAGPLGPDPEADRYGHSGRRHVRPLVLAGLLRRNPPHRGRGVRRRCRRGTDPRLQHRFRVGNERSDADTET